MDHGRPWPCPRVGIADGNLVIDPVLRHTGELLDEMEMLARAQEIALRRKIGRLDDQRTTGQNTDCERNGVLSRDRECFFSNVSTILHSVEVDPFNPYISLRDGGGKIRAVCHDRQDPATCGHNLVVSTSRACVQNADSSLFCMFDPADRLT